MNPEQLHLVTNHIPVLGLLFASIPMLVGILTKNQITLKTGLCMAFIASLSIPIVMDSGERAYERYEESAWIDAGGKEVMHTHYDRAEVVAKVVYVIILTSALALLAAWKKPKFFIPVAWVTLALSLISIPGMVWVAKSGGEIQRPDFRQQVSPPAEAEEHEHD